MFLLARRRSSARESKGRARPLLVISNHISDVDFSFVQAALPARIRHKLAIATRGEALELLRSPGPDRGWFGRIYDRVQWTLGVALLNLFPLPRQAGSAKALPTPEKPSIVLQRPRLPEGSTRKTAVSARSAPELACWPTICAFRASDADRWLV